MCQDNTCLMPGEMGRNPPMIEGKTADELITQGTGYNALKGRRMSINTGHTPPITPTTAGVDINMVACIGNGGGVLTGSTEALEKLNSSPPPKPLSCGVCGGKGCTACQGTGMFIPRKTSQGNTPGGPAREPAPPPGVGAEDEPRNIGSIAAAVDACGSFMNLDGTLVTAIKAISMRCAAAEKRVKEFDSYFYTAPLTTEQIAEIKRRAEEYDKDPSKAVSWEDVKKRIDMKIGGVPDIPSVPPIPPVRQAPPNTDVRLIIDLPERISELLEDSSRAMGVSTKTMALFAIDDYLRRRRGV